MMGTVKKPAVGQQLEFSYGEVLYQLIRKLGGWNLLYWFAVLLYLTNPLFAIGTTFVSEKYFTLMAERNAESVSQLLGLSAVFLVVLFSAFILASYMKQRVQTALDNQLMLDLAEHSLNLPLETTHHRHSGNLFQTITKDSASMTSVLDMTSRMIAQVALILLSAVYLLSLYWPLAIAVLVVNPLMLVVGESFSKRIRKASREVAEQESVVRQWLQDCLQSMEVIRSLAVESIFVQQFVEKREQLNSLQMKVMWLSVTWGALFYLSSILLAIISSAICVVLVWRGTFDVGQMMAFFLLIWRVFNPMNSLGRTWASLQVSLGATSRVAELMAEPTELVESVKPVEPVEPVESSKADKSSPIRDEQTGPVLSQQGSKVLVFDRVSFSYKESPEERKESDHTRKAYKESPVHYGVTEQSRAGLTSVSLQAEGGSFLALVGPSGSGKSTAAKLFAGLYPATSGEVWINGKNSLTEPQAARQHVAYVSQTPVLFAGTIKDNITLGREISEEKLIQAAKDAQAHRFICELPQGYDTPVKEAGSSLSGGQKQRLALAQAFLSDRPIWILDEATSALDPDTERAVMEAVIARAAAGHTLIVIAHRLSTIRQADQIYVMEGGSIMEQGTHHELLNRHEGLYQKLWAKLESAS